MRQARRHEQQGQQGRGGAMKYPEQCRLGAVLKAIRSRRHVPKQGFEHPFCNKPEATSQRQCFGCLAPGHTGQVTGLKHCLPCVMPNSVQVCTKGMKAVGSNIQHGCTARRHGQQGKQGRG
jgi:hypothetical protein